MNRIALIGAMPMEIAPLLEHLENKREEKMGWMKVTLGTLAGVPVIVGCCGISKVNAAMNTQSLILLGKPSLVIHVGVGGSLTPKMHICDVLVAKDCVQYDVDTTAVGDPIGLVSTINRVDFPCDERAVQALLRAGESYRQDGHQVLTGRIGTGDRFLTRKEDKDWIVETFGALTCDQESAAIAQVCLMNNVPCAVVRAVSDESDGAHGSEFAVYGPKAAQAAADVAEKFLAQSAKEFL